MVNGRRVAQLWTLLFDTVIVVAAPLVMGYVVVETVIDRKIELVLVVVAVAAFLWLSDVWRRRGPDVRHWRRRGGDRRAYRKICATATGLEGLDEQEPKI